MGNIELRIIDFEDKYIIYRPLSGVAFTGNRAMVEYVKRRLDGDESKTRDEIEKFLARIGFLSPDPVPAGGPEGVRARTRSIAVLLMTNACNLRCRYCYAKGGENAALMMDADSARVCIRYAYESAKTGGRDSFSVAFHGGGEPTLNWEVLEEAVHYARSLPLPCSISMSSNGVWDETKRDFILRNFDELSISFDGTGKTQNAQRPGPDGSPSFDAVMESILAVDRSKIRYGIRMTVTNELAHELPRGVALLCAKTSCPVIQVEPCYADRRGQYRDPDRRQGGRFVRRFFEAFDIATAGKRFLFYSGSRPWLVTEEFCGAPLDALIATPQKDIVGCFEIHDRNHPLFDRFVIGSLEGGRIVMDGKREAALKRDRSTRRSRCLSCFNFRHCGGDCDSRCLGSLNDGEGRCEVNRAITRGLLARYISTGEGVYRRSALAGSAPKPCAGCGASGESR